MEVGVEYDPDFGTGSERDLSDKWIEAAKVNVNDDPDLRRGRLKRLKKILKEREIVLYPGDKTQMLGMLRAGKCDPEKAADVVESFVAFQKHFSDGIPRNFKTMLQENTGSMAILPYRDKFGRRIVVYKKWDPIKYPFRTGLYWGYFNYLLLSREPKTQIAGITLVGDLAGMGMKHCPTNWNDIKIWSQFLQGGIPVWFPEQHCFNLPWILQAPWKMFQPLLSESVKNSMFLHNSKDFAELHRRFDKRYLTEEFGGDLGPINNSDFIRILLEKDEYYEQLQRSHKKEDQDDQ